MGFQARAGMSKRTSYGKIYHLDDRTRPRLPRGRVFTCGKVFTIRANNKKRIRTDAPLCPHGHKRVRADATMRPRGHRRVHADRGPTAQTSTPPYPRPLPPRSPYANGVMRPHGRGADARKIIIIIKKIWVVACWKRQEKNVRFSVFNPQDPRAP
jgi:hypothetical protein